MNSNEEQLIRAVSYGNLDYVRSLLPRKVNPNIADIDGRTPLFIASSEGRVKIVQELLLNKADPNIPR